MARGRASKLGSKASSSSSPGRQAAGLAALRGATAAASGSTSTTGRAALRGARGRTAGSGGGDRGRRRAPLARLHQAVEDVADGLGIDAAHADRVAQGHGRADGQQQGGDQVGAWQAGEAEDAGQQVQQAVAPESAQALGQRPGGRTRRGGQQAGQGQQAQAADQGADPQVAAVGGRIGLGDARHAEHQHQGGGHPAGQAHRLHDDVGQGRARSAQGVGGRQAGGGVQAGIGGVVGGDRQQQARADHADHPAPEPGRPRLGPAVAHRVPDQFNARSPRRSRHQKSPCTRRTPMFCRKRVERGV